MDNSWTSGIRPVDGAGNIYANVIATFLELAPDVTDHQVDRAREACRLIARSIVCADAAIDDDGDHDLERVKGVLGALVCQLAGVRVLHELVALSDPFWEQLEVRTREFADACREEAENPTSADLGVASRVVLGKNAPARIMAPLACALGVPVALCDELDHAIEHLIVAVQTLDDAVDWRKDLANEQLSLVTARIHGRFEKAADPAEVESFVRGTVLHPLLIEGRAAVIAARDLVALQRSASWLAMTTKILAGYEHALGMFKAKQPEQDRNVAS